MFSKMICIGVDPTAGRKPFAYAALDQDLRLLALGEGDLEEVLAFVGGQQQAFVAVNAPRQPNQGVMADAASRAKWARAPRPGRWEGFRAAEYELGQHKIRMPRTPGAGEKFPGWILMGFQVFRRLEEAGYVMFSEKGASRQVLEVYPHAAYTVLLERVPFPKHTLEGRLQRQLVLYNHKVEVPDPMRIFEEITRHRLLQGVLPLENLFSAEELDALVAAYTAWLAWARPIQTVAVGDPVEGQIVLPVGKLKAQY